MNADDKKLAILRAMAYQAFDDHNKDMATKPAYRKAVKKAQARQRAAQVIVDHVNNTAPDKVETSTFSVDGKQVTATVSFFNGAK